MRLQLHGISKNFEATHALHDVSLEVAAGEIHALLGENGAGKSTLMKILSGILSPDSGKIVLDDRPFSPGGPQEARRSGISMLFQESTLAPHLSAEENITLGAEPRRLGWIDRRDQRKLVLETMAEIQGQDIPLEVPVGKLPMAQRVRIELARAVFANPKVLILDEPTSFLDREDAHQLFATVRKMAARGVAVIYISHFLEEFQALCSRYTILRDGENVAHGDLADLDRASMIRRMVGRELRNLYPRYSHHVGGPVLELAGLSGKRKPLGIELTLHSGEIFGLAGLVGAGRTETLRAIFGLDLVTRGEIRLFGRRAPRGTPHRRLRAGLGMLGEDRQQDNLMPSRSVADNLTLPDLRNFGWLGCINTERQKMATLDWMEKLRIRARTPMQPVSELSGGNQQKVALARLLRHRAKILLLDEPTRGVDVATKAQFYDLIGELAADGKAIVFVSSYLPELLGVCDTIGVMCRGKLVAVRPARDWSEHEIIDVAIGQNDS